MSGGAYNHLYNKDHFSALADSENLYEDLMGLLPQAPEAGRVAMDTGYFVRLVMEAAAIAARLSDAWHAVEWYSSGDWGMDKLRECVSAYVPAVRGFTEGDGSTVMCANCIAEAKLQTQGPVVIGAPVRVVRPAVTQFQGTAVCTECLQVSSKIAQ